LEERYCGLHTFVDILRTEKGIGELHGYLPGRTGQGGYWKNSENSVESGLFKSINTESLYCSCNLEVSLAVCCLVQIKLVDFERGWLSDNKEPTRGCWEMLGMPVPDKMTAPILPMALDSLQFRQTTST